MTVFTLSACPPGLRGDVTRWLVEISTGVYVGNLSARVRENLWKRVCEHLKTGKATMIYSAHNEQGFAIRVHNTEWTPVDFDGVHLMRKPLPKASESAPETELLIDIEDNMFDNDADEIVQCAEMCYNATDGCETTYGLEMTALAIPETYDVSTKSAVRTTTSEPTEQRILSDEARGDEVARQHYDIKYKQKCTHVKRALPYDQWPDDVPLPLDATVIDIETTGLNADSDRMIEVAAVRIRNGQKVEEFQRLIRYTAPLPEVIRNLTGINSEMLENGAVDESEALKELLDFIGMDVIIGHNVAFDIEFVQNACRRMGVVRPDFCAIDTVQLSRERLRGSVANFRLETLVCHLGLAEKQVHRALPDSRLVAQLYAKLNEIL